MIKKLFLLITFISGVSYAATVSYYVDPTGTDDGSHGTGTGTAAWATIEYAINAVSNPTSDVITINIAADTYTTNSDMIDIDREFTDLTLQGASASTTIVQAHSTEGSATDRVFYIRGTGEHVTISALTIRHGKTPGNGGAINNNQGDLSIESCSISDNAADRAAGIYSISGSLVITNTTISGNNATSDAGAMFVIGDFTLTNSTVFDNAAPEVGGIYGQDGSYEYTLTNCTISNNTSSSSGWAGGFSIGQGGNTVYIKNTILANNTSTDGGDDFQLYSGTLVDNDYNIVEYFTGTGITFDASNNLTGNQTNLNLSSTLADNNTTNGTQTLKTTSGSVAINAGDAGTANNGVAIPSTDQRWASRNGTIDIGAYEYFSDDGSIPFAAAAPSGAGSSEDPYLITSLANLSWLCQNDTKWASYYKQTAHIDASETQSWDDADGDSDGDLYNDTNDLTSSGNNDGFSPIGSATTAFTSNYDGQGFTIDGLNIDRSSTDNIGLFGNTNGATLSDLGVTNVDITGQKYTAALVGRFENSGTMTECYSSGAITANGTWSGGLVGNNTSSITRSYSSCNVTTSGEQSGGFVGQNYHNGNISDSYCTGSVSGVLRTGGFVGYSSLSPANISRCYSTGNVEASGSYTGGFCGQRNPSNGSIISNCFYDSVSSGQGFTTDGGFPKSTSQMKDYATFTTAGWDFVSETDNGSNNYWDADQGATINNGYMILAWQEGADISLPVELSAFVAQSKSGVVSLSWTTSSEIENLGFTIERCALSSRAESRDEMWTTISSYKTNPELAGQGSTSRETLYAYTDNDVSVGEEYEYRLSDVDYQGKLTQHESITVIVRDNGSDAKPGTFKVLSVYPNPFNPSTTLSYTLEQDMQVAISVVDLRGRTVRTMTNSHQLAGDYSFEWDGNSNQGLQMNSGIYFFNIQGPNFHQAIKMVKLD